MHALVFFKDSLRSFGCIPTWVLLSTKRHSRMQTFIICKVNFLDILWVISFWYFIDLFGFPRFRNYDVWIYCFLYFI